MICYRLHCTLGHEFEGWFPNAESFDTQKARGLVLCPQCGLSTVEKSLMAPALARSVEPAPIASADQIRMALRAIRKEVESRCDNVGDRFAEEALKRHDARDDAEHRSERGIYGTMSDSERERLEDEGVDFTPVPWIDRSES